MYRGWKNCREEVKSINQSLRNNKEGIFMVLLLMAALVAVPLQYKKWMYDICYLDVFVLYSIEKEFAIIPFATLAIMFFIKSDFNQNRIIRYGSVRKAWLSTVRKVIIISFYLSIIVLAVGGICGSLFSYCDLNWHDMQSYFFWFTRQNQEAGVNYPLFLCIFFTSVFFSILIYGLLIYLIYWVSDSYLIGVAAVISMCMSANENSIFHAYFSADYKIWLEEPDLYSQLIVPFGIIILIIVLGYISVKNKQFGIERKIICVRKK